MKQTVCISGTRGGKVSLNATANTRDTCGVKGGDHEQSRHNFHQRICYTAKP